MAHTEEDEVNETELDTDEPKLEWMWGDAALGKLSKMNPLRWGRGTAEEVAAQLEGVKEKDQHRPVRLRIAGHYHQNNFESPAEAAQWVRETATEERHTDPKAGLTFMASGAKLLAAPALAFFCRLHSKQSWARRNIFVASAYARRVTALPEAIAKMQRFPSRSHTRTESSWEEFDGGRGRFLAAFISAATLPMRERPRVVMMGEETWTLLDESQGEEDSRARTNSEFWATYSNAKGQYILAFRGGDGGAEDAKNHMGSPARAFVQGEKETELPAALPTSLVADLGSRGQLSIVGYSLGAIPALTCALYVGRQDYLREVVLLSPATMFWPPWLNKALPDDWWAVSPPVCELVTNYVVHDDPLADGVPGGVVRAPQLPGTTVLLPPQATGGAVMTNHEFRHFVADAEERVRV